MIQKDFPGHNFFLHIFINVQQLTLVKRLPRQGWIYLTVNHFAFYSFLIGVETKVLVRCVALVFLPHILLEYYIDKEDFG